MQYQDVGGRSSSWRARTLCLHCGWHQSGPYLRGTCCPECGTTDKWVRRIMRWESCAVWWQPWTWWRGGTWVDLSGQTGQEADG